MKPVPSTIRGLLLIAGLLLASAGANADGPLRYHLAGGHENWPAAERQAIIDAMDEAVALYNQHGYFEKTVWANYNPAVPTAQANYDGWIEFGNLANMSTRVALHEIAHTLGVGTISAWNNNRSGNAWTGAHAIRQLRHFDGPTATLNADSMHFWPYGLNQNHEDGTVNRVRHIQIVAGMRRDMGIVPVHGGVPSDWQMFHFGFIDSLAANRDFDGDGFDDLDEYLAFTDPADPLSFPGAPALFYHWPLNETADDPAFARLEPDYQPAAGREISAAIAGAAGRDAVFIKGSDAAGDPPPLYEGPAFKGAAFARESTGSLGTASRSARIDLGNAIPGNRTFTLSFWFKRDGLASSDGLGDLHDIVSATEGEEGLWHLHARDVNAATGVFNLEFYHYGIAEHGSLLATGLASDTWYHAAIVRDEQDVMTVYLDGHDRFSGEVAPHTAPFLAVEGPDLSAGSTVAYWRFEEGPAGARVAFPQMDAVLDASGNGNHLRTWDEWTSPMYVTSTPFSPVPRTGQPNQLSLNFSGGNRDLYSSNKPINSHPFAELTVEASFNADATDAFQVIVGKDGNPIGGQPPFSLKIRADGLLEAAIADGGGARRQVMSRDRLLSGVWYSAAASLTPTEMALWLRGPGDDDYVLQNTVPISGLFPVANNLWSIGRGMWGGSHADRFNGVIDEVRISDKALGVGRLLLGHDALMDPSRSFLGFFDDVRIYDGGLRSSHILALLGVMPRPPAGLAGTVNSAGEVELTWTQSDGAESYIVRRSTARGGPYGTIATVESSEFVDTGALYGATYFYVVSSMTEHGESANSAELAVVDGAVPHAHLPFDESSGSTAADVTGNGWEGLLQNGATWTVGRIDNAVSLNGNDQFISLPAGAVEDLTDFTIAAWVRLSSSSTWARIFDFGSGTASNMFLTPQAAGTNAVRFAITNSGSGGEQQINGSSGLSTGRWTHVAVTLKGNTGTLYVNGVAVGTNESMTLRPADLGITTQNWIGRSQWPDPYLNGIVDDFWIVRGALPASDVNTLMSTGALPPPPSFVEPGERRAPGIAIAGDNVVLSFQSVAGRKYQLQRSADLAGDWMDVGRVATGTGDETEFVDAIDPESPRMFYRVVIVP